MFTSPFHSSVVIRDPQTVLIFVIEDRIKSFMGPLVYTPQVFQRHDVK